MADRVKIAVKITPVETIADENAGEHDIIASAVGKSLGGSGDANVTDYSGSAANQGYKDGTVNYLEVPDSINSTDISAETTASLIYIKNTGFTFSTAIALGVALNKAVKVMSSTNLICLLAPGEAFFLKDDNATLNGTNIHVRNVDLDGSDNVNAKHLAVEYLVVD